MYWTEALLSVEPAVLARQRRFLAWLWLPAIALSAAVTFLLPWNMDEFVMYHALACWQESQRINTFNESCFWYQTNIGPWSYYRSYAYIGVASSILLAPFHFFAPYFWTQYVIGFVLLVSISLGLVKSFRLSWRYSPLVMLVFPLVFGVLHDSGPSRLSLLVIAWTPAMATKFLGTARRSRLWLIPLLISWVVAIEDKPFFGFLLPGLALFTYAAMSLSVVNFHDLRKQRLATIFGCMFLLPVVTLLAQRSHGTTYLQFLMSGGISDGFLNRLRDSANALLFTLDWPYSTHRVVSAGLSQVFSHDGMLLGDAFTWFNLFGLSTLLIWCGAKLISDPDVPRVSALAILLAWFTFNLGSVIAGGWALHHYVFALLPIGASLALVARRSVFNLRFIGTSLMLLSSSAFAAVLLSGAERETGNRIRHIVREASGLGGEGYIINCGNWGCYYPMSLLNQNDVGVTFADTKERTVDLADTAAKLGKAVIHVCLNCGKEQVEELYPGRTVLPFSSIGESWSAFVVSVS